MNILELTALAYANPQASVTYQTNNGVNTWREHAICMLVWLHAQPINMAAVDYDSIEIGCEPYGRMCVTCSTPLGNAPNMNALYNEYPTTYKRVIGERDEHP